MNTETKYPRLWDDVAADRGVVPDKHGSITCGQYVDVGISILNGCPDCGATVAPYNSYQISKGNPYAYCRDCAGV
jgi:hypothetical protein